MYLRFSTQKERHLSRSSRFRQSDTWSPSSDDIDEERAAGHVLVAPLDDEHVLAALAHRVGDHVAPVAHMLHENLLGGRRGPKSSDEQHVRAAGSERRRVNRERRWSAHLYSDIEHMRKLIDNLSTV